MIYWGFSKTPLSNFKYFHFSIFVGVRVEKFTIIELNIMFRVTGQISQFKVKTSVLTTKQKIYIIAFKKQQMTNVAQKNI